MNEEIFTESQRLLIKDLVRTELDSKLGQINNEVVQISNATASAKDHLDKLQREVTAQNTVLEETSNKLRSIIEKMNTPIWKRKDVLTGGAIGILVAIWGIADHVIEDTDLLMHDAAHAIIGTQGYIAERINDSESTINALITKRVKEEASIQSFLTKVYEKPIVVYQSDSLEFGSFRFVGYEEITKKSECVNEDWEIGYLRYWDQNSEVCGLYEQKPVSHSMPILNHEKDTYELNLHVDYAVHDVSSAGKIVSEYDPKKNPSDVVDQNALNRATGFRIVLGGKVVKIPKTTGAASPHTTIKDIKPPVGQDRLITLDVSYDPSLLRKPVFAALKFVLVVSKG